MNADRIAFRALGRPLLHTAAIAMIAANMTASESAVAQVLCPAPRDFDATDYTVCNAVVLTWSDAQRGTAWRVYRGVLVDGSDAVLLGSFANGPVIDPTVEPGVVYRYWIRDSGGICGTNQPLEGPEAGASGTPGPPATVVAFDQASCDTVHVEWDAIPGALSYDVARGVTTSSQDATVITNTTQTFFADASADSRLVYRYWVRGRRNNCTGSFQSVGSPGSLVQPKLPDLIIDPVNGPTHVILNTAPGVRELATPGLIPNIGTGPLHLFPFNGYSDGTKDFYQRTVDCGRIVDRYVGRYGPQPPVGAVTVPHFLRLRVRERLENGNAGRVYAQQDVPAHCLRDHEQFDAALPGSPASAQFTLCTTLSRGISVGWSADVVARVDLKCVPDGALYLEQIVDPDNWIREMDETNNVLLTPIMLTGQPPYTTPPCTRPAIVARMLGPDSLIVVAGALSDSIVATVWADGITEPQDVLPVVEFAQIGYMPVSGDPARAATHQWIWTPATFFRQDGAEDVYGGALVIQEPGEYLVAFRFEDADGIEVLCDRDGTQNGFSADKTCKVRVQTTTGVGDEPAITRIAFGVLANPARGTTRFTLALPEATTARVAIHDVAGRRVRSIDAGALAAGPHVLEWDGRRDDGSQAPTGIYLARLVTSAGASLRVKWVLAP